MWNFNILMCKATHSYWVCFLFTLSIFLMCLMFIMWWMITLEQVLRKTQPVRQTWRILDLHGVWLVKKRKDTPGWSLHLPSSLALQKTELSLPVTVLCSSSIRYLHITAHTHKIDSYSYTTHPHAWMHWWQEPYTDTLNWSLTHTWYIPFLQWPLHGCR